MATAVAPCPKCRFPNAYTAVDCLDCGARLPWGDVAQAKRDAEKSAYLATERAVELQQAAQRAPVMLPVMRAVHTSGNTEIPPISVRGVKFTRVSERQIRLMAEKKLKSDRNTPGQALLLNSFGALGCGFASLFIPFVGIFLFIAFILGAVGSFVFGGGALAFSQAAPLDEKKLAGLCHQWRLMSDGICPVCQGTIHVMPASEVSDFVCPLCSVHLRYQNEYVMAV